RAGLDWARVLLYNDFRSNAVTRLDTIWSRPISGLELETPDSSRKAFFSGQIEDEQGKYNLWRLSSHGAIQQSEFAILSDLLSVLGLPNGLSTAIAKRVASSQNPQAPGSAAGIRSVSDLLAIEDMTLQDAATLSTYVTLIPEKTDINVNTATAEVLSAVIPGLGLPTARALVDERDSGKWFTSRADFTNRLGAS